MTEELARQLAELSAVHAGLANVVEEEGRTLVSGSLPFEAASAGLPTITDRFDIELAIPSDYPKTLPRVSDVGGRIDAAYEHLYTNKSFCLGVPVEERRIFLEHALPPPDIAVETRSLRLRLKLVASSNLLDYTARSVYLAAKDSLRLKALPVKELAWRRAVSVVYREGSYLSPAARQLIASIKTAVAIKRS